jgi:hypothetical protein
VRLALTRKTLTSILHLNDVRPGSSAKGTPESQPWIEAHERIQREMNLEVRWNVSFPKIMILFILFPQFCIISQNVIFRGEKRNPHLFYRFTSNGLKTTITCKA